MHNNYQLVLWFLENHFKAQDPSLTPETIIDACGNANADNIRMIIYRNGPLNVSQRTLNQCLQVASRMGRHCLVEYLIGKGADVNHLE